MQNSSPFANSHIVFPLLLLLSSLSSPVYASPMPKPEGGQGDSAASGGPFSTSTQNSNFDSSSSPSSAHASPSSIHAGQIFAIVLGIVILTGLSGFAIWALRRKHKQRGMKRSGWLGLGRNMGERGAVINDGREDGVTLPERVMVRGERNEKRSWESSESERSRV